MTKFKKEYKQKDQLLPFMTLEEEQRRYCDLVQFDFFDSYLNITMDTVSALKFALGVKWPNQMTPDFLVIADDDTYVNIPMLRQMLFQDNIISKESNYLLGEMFDDFPRRRLMNVPSDKRAISHILPDYIFSGKTYPAHFTGGLYVLPFGTLECLFATALKTPLVPTNDLFLTGFCASACGFERKNDQRILHGKKNQNTSFSSSVT